MLYIYKTFIPIKLAVIYPFQAEISFLKVLSAAFFLIAVTAVVIKYRKDRPYLIVGWFWYLIALIPVIGIIRVGKQSLADRYTYLPHIGFFILLVWGISELPFTKRISIKIKTAITIFIFSALSIVTWNQVGYWKTSMLLFNHTVDVTENNWIALGVLGYDYITANELDKALLLLNKSLALNPKNVMALHNMGVLQNKFGNREHALQHFQRVIAIEPDYKMAHYQIGLQLLFKQDTVGALQAYNILNDLDPNLARQLLGSIRIQNNSITEQSR